MYKPHRIVMDYDLSFPRETRAFQYAKHVSLRE